MNDIIITEILPVALLVILYVFIFTRKGEVHRAKVNLRGYDWITFLAVLFGICALTSAMLALGLNIPEPWLIAIPVVLVVLLFIIVLRSVRTGKTIVQQKTDERISLIYAKSSRNALFATYLAFFINSLISDAGTLDTMWLVITLASGLVVLIASLCFYYYWKS